jgi:2-polyprenyl-6-methoxyphenol hydroxylase-like FAD-dependent oxidoreductase
MKPFHTNHRTTPVCSTFDVVVVGARAAGAATAMLLARAGLSVLVVDRDRPGTDTLSTHALMRGGVVQLHRWGLLDDIVSSGAPPVRRTTFHYPSHRIPVDIKSSHGIDALYAPRRTVLDPLLVAAAQRAGAVVCHGLRVTDIRRHHSGRVVGIEARDAAGRTLAVDARFVIGADGRRSTIATLVDAPITHAVTGTSAFVYSYWSGLDAEGYEWGYGSGASAGFVPTNDGETCVFGGSSPARVGRGGIHMLEALVAAASPDMSARLKQARPPKGTRTFSGQPGYLRKPWGDGWALVGDAGSWKDPASAHGLTDAFRDAELLARAVVDGLGGGFADETEPLRRYELQRDELSKPILTAAAEVGEHRWSESRLIELLWTINDAMSEEIAVIDGFDGTTDDDNHQLATIG